MRVQRWFREFGRPPRILGLDVARALAILGMVGAHIGETGELDLTDPATWGALVHGRSSILFAVLAGVSIALMTGRSVPPDPARIPSVRLNLVGRGAVIFVIGLALEMVNTPIAVILTVYGLLYVAVIPFLRWKPWQLLLAAGLLAVSGPPLLALLTAVTLHPYGAGIGFVLYGSYPLTVWMAFLLGGLALGRLRVERIDTAVVALGVGAGLAVVGYGLGFLGSLVSAASETGGLEFSGGGEFSDGGESGWGGYLDALAASDPVGSMLSAVFAVDPHSGGTAEILGSGGFALVVIAVCLLLSRPLRPVLLPLGALGSMPLSAYSLHVVSVALLAGPGGFFQSDALWAATAVGLIVGATVWAVFLGRGPLERLVGAVARRAAEPPSESTSGPPSEPPSEGGRRLES